MASFDGRVCEDAAGVITVPTSANSELQQQQQGIVVNNSSIELYEFKSDEDDDVSQSQEPNARIEDSFETTNGQHSLSECLVGEDDHQTMSAPIYRFCSDDMKPLRLTGCRSEFSSTNNFTKGCKWSPDGLCVLTNSEDNCMRLFELPSNIYSSTVVSFDSDYHDDQPEMTPILKMQEAETVYDFSWYPLMSSMDPVTCCFVTTSRQNPIHMWDAFTGELRCSYRAYDQVDELVAATCLAFNGSGGKLYCGFNRTIRIFDVAIPGRCCQERSTKAEGQPGIISCIAVNPADENIYAAGSYLKTIAVYDEPSGSQLFRVEGQVGGVTHLMFSKDGLNLFSGGRKDPEIVCWDMRNPGRILFSMQREVVTNQRIYFDLDKSGTYMASGNNDGSVIVFDTSTLPTSANDADDNEIVLKPAMRWKASDDCINGISFNPVFPILVTSSGQRKFAEPVDDEDSDRFFLTTSTIDNSLDLWWAGGRPTLNA